MATLTQQAKNYIEQILGTKEYIVVASPQEAHGIGASSIMVEDNAPIYGTGQASEGKLVVVAEPEHHDTNGFGVNHSWTRQAILFQDGTGWYQIQGTCVPRSTLFLDDKAIFEEDSDIDTAFITQHILEQRNTEIRAAMISRAIELGHDLLAEIGYQEVENDGHVSLWTYREREDSPKSALTEGLNPWELRRVNYLRLINMTVDDGTLLTSATDSSSEANRKIYMEGVPSRCDTLQKAMNWRVGLPLDSDVSIGVRA